MFEGSKHSARLERVLYPVLIAPLLDKIQAWGHLSRSRREAPFVIHNPTPQDLKAEADVGTTALFRSCMDKDIRAFDCLMARVRELHYEKQCKFWHTMGNTYAMSREIPFQLMEECYQIIAKDEER